MPTREVSLQTGLNECSSCGHKFEEWYGTSTYGDNVIRSATKNAAAVVPIDSAGVEEIHRVTRKDGRLRGREVDSAFLVIRGVWEALADAAADGSRYEMTESRRCPACSCGETRILRDTGNKRDALLDEVTFDEFMSKPREAREAIVRNLLTKLLEARDG